MLWSKPVAVRPQVSELGPVSDKPTGSTVVEVLGGELPSVVCVTTVTVYVIPSVSPLIMQVSALGVVQVKVPDAAVAVAVYPVSVPVPRLAGAVQEIVAVVSPGVALTPVGAPGTIFCTITGVSLLVVELFPSWPLVLVPQQ